MSLASTPALGRRNIYYWKCDRPAAFHGTEGMRGGNDLEQALLGVISSRYPGQKIELRQAGGQGNHITWVARIGGVELFVRAEDGPEHDDYIEVESHLLGVVRALGIPAPRVFLVDASRTQAPFAWQVMECMKCPDLNQWHKQGRLDLSRAAVEIGAAVAKWQGLQPEGFGPFDPEVLRMHDQLTGYHARYCDYFWLNLERHLDFLAKHAFLTQEEAGVILNEVTANDALLQLERGCLVHKDLALWNILGTETEIAAFIDWDDAISGDAMDDLSLLGCFYQGSVLAHALEGYASVRPLPHEYRRRFWLHLLRNMIVKAVIRVGAGYFDRTDGFFLIGAGSSGADLKSFTQARLWRALEGLRKNLDIEEL